MNPGDDGGSLPSIDLFLFLRRIRQHTSNNAAIASTASGIPTPIPIFSRLVRPDSLDAGATGSVVELGVAEALEGEDADANRVVADEEEVASVVDDAEADPEEDAKLDVSLEAILEETVGVGIVLKLSDPDIAEDSVADSNTEEPVFEAVSVGRPVTDAVTSVGNASLAGGAAVAGPNSCMK
jgi:hypothetical protein